MGCRDRQKETGESLMRVAFLDDFHSAYHETAGVRRLRERADVEILTQPFGEASALRGFDALVATRERTRFTKELFEQLPDVKIIAQTGNHAYHIDLAAAERRGIVIGKATGGFCTAAGELAIGLMISIMRQIPSVDHAVKAGGWPTPMTRVLRGKTLGIVGLGNIGKYVARVAGAFNMKVLAWGSRLTAEAAAQHGAERRELDDLMRCSDIISVHATLSPDSRGLIDAARLALMRPTAYLVNTARGPIVDERALYRALADGRIAGAALDVFDEEPLPAAHPLRRLSNVILTSHLGWPTDEMYGQFADAAADVLLGYLDGKYVPRFVPGY
ncbi:D-2-hydroxyacid dehydrogenase family protein [Bradyrhizobium sp. ISRA463]|nr:D-2-hydroxyacid dehydrogenase family protein [Bradyrhizobium sp. ISRA463]WGS17857.1 D-2-hydroxyacid dehydrogenase family protein [Bradyrhizobium sp. ISRA463]